MNIHDIIADELREYLEHVYELPDTERIFPVGQEQRTRYVTRCHAQCLDVGGKWKCLFYRD